MLKRNSQFAIVLTAISVVGCSQSVAHRLVGTWEGQPSPAVEDHPTQLDDVQIQVTLQLHTGGDATLHRAGDPEMLSGHWSLLESTGATARLQLGVERSAGGEEQAEIRNFRIEFLDEGNRFKLSEEGADPEFGSLEFVRKL